MKGEVKPDYARCVSISTAGAQREMIFPSLIAIVVPVAVGLIFNVGGVLGLLAGGLGNRFRVGNHDGKRWRCMGIDAKKFIARRKTQRGIR